MKDQSILIVEDEAIVSADLQACVRKSGYHVCGTAATGEEALRLAGEAQPDLVLMDICLAGQLDGIATAQLLRERTGVPVIYLTAYSDEETLERAKVTQPYGYLLKPLEQRELVTTVEMAIYKHDMEKEQERLMVELEKALEEVKTLRGLLPICSGCKKIRDTEGEWQQIEKYITTRTDAVFSHGYCPDCYNREVAALDAVERIGRGGKSPDLE